MKPIGTLVIVRHGQSRFNELNIFTGWLDVPLSEKGIEEAHKVAEHCMRFDYDKVFTSELKRAHETLTIILSKQSKVGIFYHSDRRYLPAAENENPRIKLLKIYTSEALNERSYGTLQGMDKDKVRKAYGEQQVSIWRRSFEARPPEGESLKDVYERVVPYYEKDVVPSLEKGETDLLVGHGNNLRALIKHLENIADDQIPFIDLPLGTPLVYQYKDGKIVRTEGSYQLQAK